MSFFNFIKNRCKYDEQVISTVNEVFDTIQLKEQNNRIEEPLAIVGQVQSGKTNTFLGVAAKCLDHSYDMVVLLTKSNNVLAEQTFKRVVHHFSLCDSLYSPIGSKQLKVHFMGKLNPQWQGTSLNNTKHILIVLKERANCEALLSVLSSCRDKKILLIDDEADYGSLSYNDDHLPTLIMQMITMARSFFNGRDPGSQGILAYLQVTATPGALLFQRPASDLDQSEYISCQPSHIILLPTHKNYFGGDELFSSSTALSETDDPPKVESFIYKAIQKSSIQEFKSKHPMQDKETLHGMKGMLNFQDQVIKAILSYIVATAIRSFESNSEVPSSVPEYAQPFKPSYASSCLIHLSNQQADHQAQALNLKAILEKLSQQTLNNEVELKAAIELQLTEFSDSIQARNDQCKLPNIKSIYPIIKEWLTPASIDACIIIVNSDQQLDLSVEAQQLIEHRTSKVHLYKDTFCLEKTLNFFIGGEVFTRGVTLNHLLTTIYDRETSDIDTTVQHARWYGNRSLQDRSVMRLLMPEAIYKKHKLIHKMNQNLFKQIELTSGKLECVAVHQGDSLPYTNNARLHQPSFDQISGQKIYVPSPHQVEISTKHLQETMQIIEEQLTAVAGLNLLNQEAKFQATYHQIDSIIDLIDSYLDFDRNQLKIWNHEVLKSHILVGTKFCRDKLQVIYEPNLQLDFKNKSYYLSPSKSLSRYSYDSDRSQIPVLVLAKININQTSHLKAYWPLLISPIHINNYKFIHTDFAGE